MNVAILGGTRFVGEAIARRFLAGGARVTLFNRGRTPDDFGALVERRRVDRSQPGALSAAFGEGAPFDAVVDTTAYVARDSEEAIRAFGGRCARFIHISTGQVYLIRRDYRAPAREDDVGGDLLPQPEAAPDLGDWQYGIGKWACEQVLAASALPAVRVRLPIVLGPRDHTGRLCAYVRQIRAGQTIRAADGGRNVLRHVNVEDVAGAVVALAGPQGKGLRGQAINLAQAETPTLAELCVLIAELVGRPSPPAIVQAAGESPFSGRWTSVLDIEKARRTIDWRPTVWRETIAAAMTGCS